MKVGDLVVYEPEKRLMVVLVPNYKPHFHKVRDAKDKRSEPRILLQGLLRQATDADLDYIIYLYQDEETGQVQSLKLQKDYVSAVRNWLSVGKCGAIPAKDVLLKIGKTDSDTTRRQFRAAVAYWIEQGILICSTTSGYFIADNAEEVNDCVSNKEKQAQSNLRRAELLRSMDIEESRRLFLGNVSQVAAA